MFLVQHYTKEANKIRQHISYYQNQYDQAVTRLADSKSKLARLRGHTSVPSSNSSQRHDCENVNVERRSTSPLQISENSSHRQNQPKQQRHHGENVNVERRSSMPSQISEGSSQRQNQPKPPLVIPAVSPMISQPASVTGSGLKATNGSDAQHRISVPKHSDSSLKNKGEKSAQEVPESHKVERVSSIPVQITKQSSQRQNQPKPQLVTPVATPTISQPVSVTGSGSKASNGSHAQPRMSVPSCRDSFLKEKGEKSLRISSEREVPESRAKGTKRKFEQKENKELMIAIRTCSFPQRHHFPPGRLIPSQHNRKLRSLVLCPTRDNLFVTSALDGHFNLWEIQGRGSDAHLLSTTDCMSPKKRRWPEDITWHPDGNSIFSAYTADEGDSQISMMELNERKKGMRVQYFDEKPHVKGIINSIKFMPWEDTCFVTGGSDHGVVLWTDKYRERKWKPDTLHHKIHSSAVMGVAGLQYKQVVISAGLDRRIIGFDVLTGREAYKHQIESKCLSVLPNPCDFNLFMVQTGYPEKQLRLFDIRSMQRELHSFGWKQEKSETQSALVNQAWAPNGFHISSGSADPIIHIFDIRYHVNKPSQSIEAHQKRVFKAEWHQSLPLLISMSSDLSIGLHKIEKR